eukprot:11328458-Heterocapsa_arctica.AAC.1
MVNDRASLRLAFSKAKSGKVAGIDGVLGDLLKAAPTEMAAIVHPLLVKVSLRCQEPLTYKGGIAVDLYKGKGEQAHMSNYRSVLLNSV